MCEKSFIKGLTSGIMIALMLALLFYSPIAAAVGILMIYMLFNAKQLRRAGFSRSLLNRAAVIVCITVIVVTFLMNPAVALLGMAAPFVCRMLYRRQGIGRKY